MRNQVNDRKAWRLRLPRWVLVMQLETKDMLISALQEDIRELEQKLKKKEAGIE
ncbi:hypothetical protein [Methylococcus mesophilus]|uniref:hypothetical protein n=1 Tax=Methylococcus mesophilus TaxID=2993564 RepID=UPI00224AB5D9|nr:hypothetical protein [Methylococcus mesophilus]UZR30271.1 hypothetical protein OOT43_06430 [Methylococcus mesophilus]